MAQRYSRASFVWVILITGVFVFGNAWILVREAIRLFTWQQVGGQITSVHRPDENASSKKDITGWITYAYTIDGKDYQGIYPPKYDVNMPRPGYPELNKPSAVGDAVTCYVNPQDASQSRIHPRVNPMAWGFIAFALPMFIWGWYSLLGGPHTRELQNVGNDGTQLIGGSGALVVYILVSAVVAFGMFVGFNYVSWQTGQIIAATMTLIVLPGGAWWMHRLTVPRTSHVSRRMRDQRKKAMALCAATLFWWAISGVFLADSVVTVTQYIHARSAFQPVTCTITRTGMREHHNKNGYSYQPVIVYTYRVAGREYESNRRTVGLFPMSMSRKAADQIIAEYPIGKPATAYYDPRRPHVAVLSIDPGWAHWGLAGFMLIFVVLGVVIGVAAYRSVRACFTVAASSDQCHTRSANLSRSALK